MAARHPKRVTSQVFRSFLLGKVFISCKREDRGGIKMPYDFLFTFVTISQQTAGLEKNTLVWNVRLIKTKI